MQITNITRTVDSNGRVWVNTQTRPGYPDMSAHYARQAAQPQSVALVPDSELAELAELARALNA